MNFNDFEFEMIRIFQTDDLHRNDYVVTISYSMSFYSFLQFLFISAQDLPSADPETCLSDPYVRICLQPEVDNKTRQSSIKRRTTDPVFDEYHKFPVTHDELKVKSV